MFVISGGKISLCIPTHFLCSILPPRSDEKKHILPVPAEPAELPELRSASFKGLVNLFVGSHDVIDVEKHHLVEVLLQLNCPGIPVILGSPHSKERSATW